MPRSKLTESDRSSSVRLSVSLPQPLHSLLEKTAQENDASIAWVVRRAVARYLHDGGLHDGGGSSSSNAGR